MDQGSVYEVTVSPMTTGNVFLAVHHSESTRRGSTFLS